jgi:hypothetical protein
VNEVPGVTDEGGHSTETVKPEAARTIALELTVLTFARLALTVVLKLVPSAGAGLLSCALNCSVWLPPTPKLEFQYSASPGSQGQLPVQ